MKCIVEIIKNDERLQEYRRKRKATMTKAQKVSAKEAWEQILKYSPCVRKNPYRKER